MAGRPPHMPSDEQREKVKSMCAAGLTRERIASIIGIDHKTLLKHYEYELENASAIAVDAVAGALFNNAVNLNNVTAQIFYLKTRGRWKEAATEVQLTGANGGPIKSLTAGAVSNDPIEAAKAYAKLMAGEGEETG